MIDTILVPAAVGISLIVLNFGGLTLAHYFSTMVFLDTVGTAIAGVAFGPWQGAVVGLLTNVVIGLLLFRPYLNFFYVNVLCGIVWGVIGQHFPVAPDSDIKIIVYILAVGGCVGFVSALLSVPLRIIMNFNSQHMLDQLGREFYQPSGATGPLTGAKRVIAVLKIFATEYLLGHFLDKAISTTVAVMLFVEMLQQKTGQHAFDAKLMYHDLVELLGAYYYVAMGFAIKTLGANLPQQPIVALLGPLGFFGLLIALPVVISSFVYLIS
jgi:hypothetical protein